MQWQEQHGLMGYNKQTGIELYMIWGEPERAPNIRETECGSICIYNYIHYVCGQRRLDMTHIYAIVT